MVRCHNAFTYCHGILWQLTTAVYLNWRLKEFLRSEVWSSHPERLPTWWPPSWTVKDTVIKWSPGTRWGAFKQLPTRAGVTASSYQAEIAYRLLYVSHIRLRPSKQARLHRSELCTEMTDCEQVHTARGWLSQELYTLVTRNTLSIYWLPPALNYCPGTMYTNSTLLWQSRLFGSKHLQSFCWKIITRT